MKLARRLVSLLLAAGMTVSFVPASSFAADPGSVLPGSWRVQAQGTAEVILDEESFPDENFRRYLCEELFNGTKSDGDPLTAEELESVTEIYCSDSADSDPDSYYGNITSLEGIEYFPNLKTLSCSGTGISSLDVSSNKQLTDLTCTECKLTSLTTAGAIALKTLTCDRNFLTGLDIRSNPNLLWLNCTDNLLGSLDVSGNAALQHLGCGKNQLSTLDVQGNTALTYLDCSGNLLSDLDVCGNADLKSLFCGSNQLTGLDLGGNPNLQYLHCENNRLAALDLDSNPRLSVLWCGENQLTSLDISSCSITRSSNFKAAGNSFTVCIGRNNELDLSALPGHFNADLASSWQSDSGSPVQVVNDLLNFDANATQITYTYHCGSSKTATFTLDLHRHAYGSWQKDETSHWYECTDPACPDRERSVTDRENHRYTDGTDDTCRVCNYRRTLVMHTVTLPEGVTGVATTKGTVNGTIVSAPSDAKITFRKPADADVIYKVDGTELAADEAGVYTVIVGAGDLTVTAETVPEPEPTPEPKPEPEEGIRGRIALPEDGSIAATDPDGVRITSAAKGTTVYLNYDLSRLPEDQLFDGWKVTDRDGNTLEVTRNADGKFCFLMPEGDVKIELKITPVNADPDAPAAPSTTDGVSAAGIVTGGVALGAAGYLVGTQLYLRAVLPGDAPIPTSRGALATLLWTAAGKPEPAAALYADFPEPEVQKAALWCTEQGLLAGSGEGFKPDGYVTRVQVIRSWNALQKLLR